MKVNLQRTFSIAASAEQAWLLLQDVERVAGCMPGAKITERIDDRHYKGTVAVRFGPANMSFRGEVHVEAIEPSTRTLRLVGKGTDATGGSGASLDLTARVGAAGEGACELVGSSEMSISGKAAAFGGRMAESVAEQVLKQFATNFAAELQTRPMSTAGTPPSTDAAIAAAPTPPPKSAQLNGLALLWGAVVGWFRSLFNGRGA